jgi:hypothetical protein
MMFRSLVWLVCAGVLLHARIVPFRITPDSNTTLEHIVLLDQKQLDIARLGGLTFSELSDAAYDPDSRTLWLISDRGRLFAFRARFGTQSMELIPLTGYNLRTPKGHRLKPSRRDSEGLARDGKGRLWVSFEHKPRIARIDTHGRIVRTRTLPKPLRALSKYRSKNKGIEALAWHPTYGLIAALEYPPEGTPLTEQTLYALSGKQWHFQAEQIPGSAVTAVEIMDDGNMLVLERALDIQHFALTITLKKVYLDTCTHGRCRTEVLAQMSTADGWNVDNFEGLARVAPHRYVMVSDDNNNPFQKTLLVYFEVRP